MSNKMTIVEYVEAMCDSAEKAESVAAMQVPGTFARAYGEQVKADLNGGNVEAFIGGSAVMSLLTQEAILRVLRTASEVVEDDTSDFGKVYAAGVREGATLIAKSMGMTADQLISDLATDAIYDRAFENIAATY